jgi:hypothetical protein
MDKYDWSEGGRPRSLDRMIPYEEMPNNKRAASDFEGQGDPKRKAPEAS